ncbi:hypothetical protein EDB89DRAFT_1909217 [Lactarius sanguifluus]|nr:hypothetical protein EDB89DRAFT_1909217 [Lactarius sanguifluus]
MCGNHGTAPDLARPVVAGGEKWFREHIMLRTLHQSGTGDGPPVNGSVQYGRSTVRRGDRPECIETRHRRGLRLFLTLSFTFIPVRTVFTRHSFPNLAHSMALVGSRPRRNLREASYSRDSNTLRASVLDAALELGIGTSRAVENLIFNTVDEEDDADNFTTPALTSASATTSDENSPSVPPWNATPLQFVPPEPTIVVPPPTFDIQYTRAPSEDSHSYAPSSLRSNQPRKLRKARKDDGYDSDGGYLSDSSKKKKKGKDRKNAGSSSHEADSVSDGGYLSDATKKKKKDKKGDKVTDGYVTDSSTKTHHKLTKKSRGHVDDADLSDGGYLSEASVKKKKPFFRLGSRSPSTSRKAAVSFDSLPPPVPALPSPMHPIADRFARSPVSFDQLDGARLSSAAPSIRAAYSPVPPSVDGSVTPLSSVYRGGWSPPPPSDSVRTATRPSSVDLSTENFSSSSASHENIQFAPVSPPMQAREAVPYDPPRARSRDAESRTLSPGSSHEQLLAAPVASRQHGVRFTPSTRFSPSDGAFPIPPPPLVSAAPEKRHLRPKISLPITSTFNSNPSYTPASPLPSILRNAPPMSAPSDSRPFLSPVTRSHLTPSPGIPNAPFLRGASPSLSDISIISSSEFIVPSPRPRFFDELPPPSPPPTCPLPEVPSSYGFSSQQQIPHIKRGRESPFPARGILPAEEASRLIESTMRARREALLARLADSEEESRAEMSPGGNGNGPDVDVDDNDVPDLPWLTEDVPTPPASLPLEQQREDEQDWPDDESVRPDVAQFYLYAPSGNSNSGGVGGSGNIVARRRRTPDAPHDERSTYTSSYATSTAGGVDTRGDIESYYFGVPDAAGNDSADDGEATESRASFVDDERSHSMRARLVARVDALYGTEKLSPVPKLRPF